MASAKRSKAPVLDAAKCLVIRLYPCRQCSFALATHARKDVVFGIGDPYLCADCVVPETTGPSRRDDPEDWVRVELTAYGKSARIILEALGEQRVYTTYK